MDRRAFIGKAGISGIALLSGLGTFSCSTKKREASGEFLFLETEQFEHIGGWELDQQSLDLLGSSYLLAHGLGIPVENARTELSFPAAGKYRIWVRTRDWVAPWGAPGAPGKFQVLINDEPCPVTFGTEGAEWHWQDGGILDLPEKAEIALHDLTGFEGRCEAILFCRDLDFVPSDDRKKLTAFRRKLLGLPDEPEDGGSYNLAVIGGGLAGCCVAIAAARNGLKVVLVQDRPVLGGNSSSEVRVWPEGHTLQDPFPHIGEIVEELVPDPAKTKYGSRNALRADIYDDARKLEVISAEPNITLMLEEHAIAIESKGDQLQAVIIQNTRNSHQKRIKAKVFADCTGDATIGFLAGADYEIAASGIMGMSNLWNVLDASDKAEVLKCDCKDKAALTISCNIGNVEQPFPRCPWAIDLSDKKFPGRKGYKGQWGSDDPLGNLGGWFWESGFDKNPITEVELIRDLNFRAMYGAWDVLKNVDKLYPNHRLEWAAFIAGKRESRRLMGDVVLTADDFRDQTSFEDPAFPCSWSIDVHSPDSNFDDVPKGDEFIAQATTGKDYDYQGPYWAPYRILYSRNIGNLFMAGRNISVNKDGLGPVRVMRTCGMMGEVVGKAASICIQKNATPREVYEKYLPQLKEMMQQPAKG